MSLKRLAPALVALLAFTFAVPAQAITLDAKRKRLDEHLESIRDWAHTNRVVGGSVMLGLGVAGAIGGAATDGDTSTILWVAGGIFAVGGGLMLVLPTDNETLPEKYQELKIGGDTSLEDKVTKGETTLRNLSDKAAQQRYIGAGSSVAVGAALIVLDVANDDNTSVVSSDETGHWYLYSGLIVAGTGIVQLFVKSRPEAEHEAYQDWLKGGEKAAQYSPFQIALAPAKNGPGAAMGLSYRF